MNKPTCEHCALLVFSDGTVFHELVCPLNDAPLDNRDLYKKEKLMKNKHNCDYYDMSAEGCCTHPSGQRSCGCIPIKKICYQCEQAVAYLFDDGRCKDCTRLTPEEVRGEAD